ncbi:MAG: hypothetical protein B5766_02745 [Candidatus Lumbricidophila eiseniae]|uniref:DUF306 domain-containing protein n=1 Tax=Candidatus Lumbricidiphila eiseniae TaxID=1969409 RepID=A0A2A6FUG3_9MICO|nr:MAG: hypothetical protein B5766_02745 [Candidatus Lumbricidophila eiseniae]
MTRGTQIRCPRSGRQRHRVSVARGAGALLLGAVVLLFTGCTPANTPPSSTEPQQPELSAFVGHWVATSPTTAFLRVASDGSVTGHDGCNAVTGSATVVGGVLQVSRGLDTLKACTGVDTWLSKIGTARVSGDTLTVYDSTDSVIGTLRRG